ncbi:DUF2332 domain-containing protein [Kribbella sp. NPDC048915]|uniref:DUF2332 domain-containing protein n=1 Tax=Kribbella sp. NPDC048915 TaxID=3155148 RepID=UPI0033DC8521
MAGAGGGRAGRAGRKRTVADVFRRFAEVDGPKVSPVYAQIASALSESSEAVRVIESAPARSRHPSVVLAALHYLALSGEAPDLAEALTRATASATSPPSSARADWPTGAGTAVAGARHGTDARVGTDAEAWADTGAGTGAEAGAGVGTGARVGAAAVDVVRRVGVEGLAGVVRRRVLGDEGGRHALVYPLVAEVARRVGAGAVGLIDMGRPAGLNLVVDRVGIAYGNGQSLGDSDSGVQVSASVVGDGRLPSVAMPEVAARVLVADDPVDLGDPDEMRWLRACVPPDQVERAARLEAELALAQSAPPMLVTDGMVDGLPEAIAAVPEDVLPVVITTWTLSGLDLEQRLRFLQRLDEAATRRPVTWLSVEGVGVAPGVPTFGDRKASGHSILGVGVFQHASFHAASVGRCWLRGEMLAWLAGS